ncbi:MAG: hypothetical protein Q4F97_09685 [Bacteroidales bacterium]|nr:hypothetical protein [Bacteroidales bacterium]
MYITFFLSFISCSISSAQLVTSVNKLLPDNELTYNIVSLKDGTLPLEIDFINYSIIAQIVRIKMKSLGYKVSKTPELFINIGITRELKSSNPNIPNGAYAVFIAPRINLKINVPLSLSFIQDTYTSGRLVFDIINIKDKRYLTSFVTEPVINKKNGKLASAKELSKYIDSAFDKYFRTSL